MSSVTQSPTRARRSRLRTLLQDAGLDALLVTNLLNIRYLTGFTGSNAALLVSADDETDEARTTFCTDGRYTTQSSDEVPDLPRRTARPCDLALLADAAGTVGFEAAHVSVLAAGSQFETAGDRADLVATAELVEQLRAVKDAGEIESLRTACAVADQALAELIAGGGIRAGRSEREISLDLDQRMRTLGPGDPSFETIVAVGANSAIPHHRPTGSVLATGDLVKLDFGATVDGYHSDMTRTFVLGTAAGWQREIYELVAAAQKAGRDAVAVGTTTSAVDAAARAVIADAGYGSNFTHGLGHGVGLEIHEAPSLAETGTGSIAADMCVTIEPGIYLPGRGGVRIEDTGVVRDGAAPGSARYEVLTLTSKELIAL